MLIQKWAEEKTRPKSKAVSLTSASENVMFGDEAPSQREITLPASAPPAIADTLALIALADKGQDNDDDMSGGKRVYEIPGARDELFCCANDRQRSLFSTIACDIRKSIPEQFDELTFDIRNLCRGVQLQVGPVEARKAQTPAHSAEGEFPEPSPIEHRCFFDYGMVDFLLMSCISLACLGPMQRASGTSFPRSLHSRAPNPSVAESFPGTSRLIT